MLPLRNHYNDISAGIQTAFAWALAHGLSNFGMVFFAACAGVVGNRLTNAGMDYLLIKKARKAQPHG